MILSAQQKAALERLMPVARIATSGIRSGLPVLPRTHTLIMGPSGSGKSFLARAVSKELGIPSLAINVGSWMVIGSREGSWTTTLIADWLDRLPPAGGVLVLEEIDKLGPVPQSTWDRGVFLECHDLLDGILPAATPIPAESLPEESFPNGTGTDRRGELEAILREKVLILGCGAWQSAWRGNTKTMGFKEAAWTLPDPPSREQILQSIAAELRQRFRDEVLVLPPMLPQDYARVAQEIARAIPSEFRGAWQKEIGGAIVKAADGSLGMRAMEELLLKAMLLSGKGMAPCEKAGPHALKPPRPVEKLW